jgi:hypothetical protein
MVYTLALKMLKNAAEAEDLTQEIFVNFWQQQKYDPNRGRAHPSNSQFGNSTGIGGISNSRPWSMKVSR